MSLYLRNFFIYFIILLSVFVATGCAEDDSVAIEVTGTWVLEGTPGWEEKWVISENRIQYLGGTVSNDSWPTTNYEADIVYYANSGFNGGDSDSSDNGYAVIKLTYAANVGWGVAGKYNIFRWKDITSSNVAFVQGSKDDPNVSGYSNQLFDNRDDAESEITDANGYFGWYSAGAVQE